MRYDYEPKGLAVVLGLLLDGMSRKGFSGFIDDLEAEVQARALLSGPSAGVDPAVP
ncbi:MAG: hypothetical protein AAF682_00070 [Planctomycetota bacterium]